MDYYFNGKEFLINEVDFLSRTYCRDYDYYNFEPIISGKSCCTDIDSEKLYSKNLMVNYMPENSVTSFEFNIFSEKNCYAIFLFHISSAAKLWINGEILVSDEDSVHGMYVRELKKGRNRVCGEFFASERKSVSFVCRVSGYDEELRKKYDNITESRNLFVSGLIKPMNMWDQKTFFDEKIYNDCIFLRNIKEYDILSPIEIKVFFRDNISPIEEKTVYFNKKYTLNLSEYRKIIPDGLYDIVVEYNFLKNSGKKETVYRSLLIKDFNSEPYNSYEDRREFPQIFYNLYLDTVKSKNILGKKFDIKEDRIKKHYFKSKLDGSMEKFHINVPFNCKNSRKYPLLLCVSTVDISDFSFLLDLKNIFVADVSGRGVTGGSYIGEAAVLESLNEIEKIYNIDKNRIYLMGFSNGSYAAVNIMLHYPHIFAGAYSLAGKGDSSLIKNIKGKTYFNIYSSYDGAGNSPCLDIETENNENFEIIDCPVLNHNLLLYYCGQTAALKKLFKKRTEKYPLNIRAKTYSIRHRRFYWFEFLNISFSKKYAEADISAKDGELNISVINCDKFSIDIPPCLQGKKFIININGSSVSFSQTDNGKLCFEKNGEKFAFTEDTSPKDPNKGTGLLNIYYDPLTICIADESLRPIAENFSKPSTNGYVPEVFTSYPVLSSDKFDKNKSAVILDDSLDIFSDLHKFLPVRPKKDGFIYKGEKYDGKYCVMQIMPNPYAPAFNILYISANDSQLFKRNFLLRKVIMPFDSNGRNPHWNNEALIFYNNKYYTIYENNGEIKAYLDGE